MLCMTCHTAHSSSKPPTVLANDESRVLDIGCIVSGDCVLFICSAWLSTSTSTDGGELEMVGGVLNVVSSTV